MESRKYSVKEIDDLRKVVRDRYLYGTSYHSDCMSFSRRTTESELQKVVEEQIRTHMLAGHVAMDILVSDGYREK